MISRKGVIWHASVKGQIAISNKIPDELYTSFRIRKGVIVIMRLVCQIANTGLVEYRAKCAVPSRLLCKVKKI